MGVFDQDLILPGTITEIVSDYSYGYDTSKFGTTDSITIIGTAFNGPVGKSVEIYSPEHARYIFGGTYDYKTRKEATLVAEIQDAWDRGCRTIYAVRVSGKNISKNYQFAINSNLKLKVSGIFPSNENKDVYMVYDDTLGASKIKIYKPAKRATIQEKVQGIVEKEESIIVTTLELTNSYGLTRDSRLVELIKIFNEHVYNNVLKLSIVDENDDDVTISSKEAQSLSIGAMFAGAYFIGRDKNNGVAVTDLSYVFADDTHKPYSSFEGSIYKTLVINTDINNDLPISGKLAELNTKFIDAGVTMNTMFDILEIPGKVDQVFGKNSIDYEEVEISDFELYEKLGSGFAITAKAELTPSKTDIKVKETPINDPNRTLPIKDGIYSMLENLKSNYRILTNGVADKSITGRIPRKASFKIATATEYSIFDNKVIAKAKLDKKDLTNPKKFRFVLKEVDSTFGNATTIKPLLYTSKVIKRIGHVTTIDELKDMTFNPGTLFMVGDTLYRFDETLTALDDATIHVDLVNKLFMIGDKVFVGSVNLNKITFAEVPQDFFGVGKEYVLVESADTVSVYNFNPADPSLTFTPVGALHEVFGDSEDKTLVTIQAEDVVENTITIQSAVLDYTTLEEFVEALNTDEDLGRFFNFSIAPDAILSKDEYVSDPLASVPLIVLPAGEADPVAVNKNITYDTTIYVPYKTTDNFARHLAQHCTYTSLKTAPTHGIMGCSKLMDVNINSVVQKVDQLVSLDLNLYAKNANGRDMLDRNNLPYPIGRNVSVVVGQYVVNDENGYSYISNGAAGYAGMVSVLPLDQSSTSQPINIPNPMYELTNYQLERLTLKGYITFKQSYTRGFVVTDGVTMAPVDSSFRRLSVTRIINVMEEVIRRATEPFIGKQNHLANRNSMQTAIRSELEKLKGKLIEGYEFKLVVDPATLKLGIVDIDYTIIPIYEIREIRNRITVRES